MIIKIPSTDMADRAEKVAAAIIEQGRKAWIPHAIEHKASAVWVIFKRRGYYG